MKLKIKKSLIILAIYAVPFLVSHTLYSRIQNPKAFEFEPEAEDPEGLVTVKADNRKAFVFIERNRVVTDSNLFEVMKIDPYKNQSAQDISLAVKKALKFYKNAGFELAEIAYKEVGGKWYIVVDEGLLESIRIVGLDWYSTYKYRNSLLPFDVFNRTRLEKNLIEMSQNLKAEKVEYELVKLSEDEVGAVFDNMKTVKSLVDGFASNFLNTGEARYKLHIFVTKQTNDLGFNWGISYSGRWGFKGYVEYGRKSMIMKDDRFIVSVANAIDNRPSLDPSKGSELVWSLGKFGTKWYTPPLGVDWLRINLNQNALTTQHHRPDLPLDQYQLINTTASMNMDFEYLKNHVFYVTLGLDYKTLVWIENAPGNIYPVSEKNTYGLVAGAGLDMLFGKPGFNKNLNHCLRIEYLNYFKKNSENWYSLLLNYQKVFFSKYADFLIRGMGIINFGDLEFYEEFELSRLIRGAIGKYTYTRKSFGFTFEPRFNVYKKIFQMVFFSDTAVYGKIDRSSNGSKSGFTGALGPGALVMFVDAFQLEVYYAFGYITTGQYEHDLVLGFSKIF